MRRLSVVIITRNEEKNLPRCLDSVAWADEIIVVDSGSTDDTLLIARERGAQVLEVEWRGYGASKQAGLEQVTGDWVLSIDADEEVTPDLRDEIKAVLQKDGDVDGYHVPRLTLFLGRWMRHGGWYPDYVLRLFRRVRGRFSHNLVHESVEVEGPTRRLAGHLKHYCYPDLETYLQKFNRYTSMAAQEAQQNGRRVGIARVVVNPAAKFIKQYLLKAGFLDGVEGLLLALLSSGYVMTKYAKLRELNRHQQEKRSDR